MPFDWNSVLDAWLPADSRRPGATSDQLDRAESRLGIALPPSYRAFLRATNGCMTGGDFVYELWGAETIDWFQRLDPQWVRAYTGPHLPPGPTVPDSDYFVYGPAQDPVHLRVEYLPTALQISPMGDSAVYLLNPKIVAADGEWEAWFFANWLPGAARYRSFADMIVADYSAE